MVEKQVILTFVNNLMFSTRIESIVEQLGFEYQEIGAADNESEKSFLDRIMSHNLALIIVDLGFDAIPWEKWIQLLKSSSVSKHIPLICFGAHVDVEALKTARQAGADEVMARSRFLATLPNLIEKHTHPER